MMDIFDIISAIPTWLLLSVGVIGLYTYYMSATHGIFKKLGVPGPRPLPILGNSLFVMKTGIFKTVVHGYTHFKSKGLYGTFDGRTPILNVTNLDMLKEIMVKQSNCFIDRRQYAAMNQKGIGKILFNVRGQEWKDTRTLLRPGLNPARLKGLYPRIVKPCQQMISVIESKAVAAKDSEVEIMEIIGCLCMDIIADFGFDIKCDSLADPDHDYVSTARRILDVFGERTFTYELFAPPFVKPILDALGITILPKKEIYHLRDISKEAVAKRRRQAKSDRPEDLLQYMIDLNENATDGKRALSEEEIISAALTLFLAGYDTSAKGFFYNMYQLAMNPECFKKAQKEVDDVLGGKFPTMESVQDLKYLDQCINEGSRIIPLGVYVERCCTQETTVLGQKIPRGMAIRVPVAGIHMDPEFYPDPVRFDPDRFTPDKVKARHPMAFLPFGAGPRSCFGQPLAMMIMRIGMAALLQTFNMEPCSKSEYPIRLLPMADVMADHGLWLKVTRRKPNSHIN